MKILNVFTNQNRKFGNPVGIIVDTECKIDNKKRQQMAIDSGFSEIVFINNIGTKDVSIFSPTRQIPFAGHALVGVSYYFNNILNIPTTEIVSMENKVETYQEKNLTFVKADISILPNWNFKELQTPEDVEKITLDESKSFNHTFVWSFLNKENGVVRARTFASDWKIPEDEANGSGSMKLAHDIDRKLEIRHGKGSIIYAKPVNSEVVLIGGLVNVS